MSAGQKWFEWKRRAEAAEAHIKELEKRSITEDQIKRMVDRFLGWRLPEPWNPDNGISYQRPNYAHEPADHDWPTGTNLFDATQADAMVRHMIEGPPAPASASSPGASPDSMRETIERNRGLLEHAKRLEIEIASMRKVVEAARELQEAHAPLIGSATYPVEGFPHLMHVRLSSQEWLHFRSMNRALTDALAALISANKEMDDGR